MFHGRGYASLQQSSAETVAQRAAAQVHADRMMNEAGAGDTAIDYGTGADDYISAGGGGDGGGSGGSGGSGGGIGFGLGKRSHEQMTLDFLPRPTDYLQAFSHFSYHHSERKMLVCDLQGVMSHNSLEDPNVAGVFELTGEFPLLLLLLLLLVLLLLVLPRPCCFWGGGLPGRGRSLYVSLLILDRSCSAGDGRFLRCWGRNELPGSSPVLVRVSSRS